MGTSTNLALRYPDGLVGVAPDPVGDIRNLAQDMDAKLTQTGTITFAGTATANATPSLMRAGNVVTLNVVVNSGTNGVPAGGLFATLPAGFRPLGYVAVVSPIYTAGSGYIGNTTFVELSPNGQMNYRWSSTTIPANSLVHVHLTFVGV